MAFMFSKQLVTYNWSWKSAFILCVLNIYNIICSYIYIYIYIYRFAELDYLVEDIYCYSEFHAPCGAIIRQLPKITDTYGDVQNLKIQNNA